MASRQPRRNEEPPVFRTGMNSSVRDRDESARVAGSETSRCERSKVVKSSRLQRKPPVPPAAAAAPHAQVIPRAESGSSTRRRDGRADQSSPRRDIMGIRSPRKRDKPVEQRIKGQQPQPRIRDGGSEGTGRGGSREMERKHLLRMLRQAVEEMDVLRRDLVSAHRERAVWKQRDEDLSRTILRLEGRCEALEGSIRTESDAGVAEAARTKVSEARFARLLAWAREEERRRLQAEDRLKRACDAENAAEERGKALEEEAGETKRQLDERRFKLEGALDDLRCRTSDNQRLETQAASMKGQVEALRELADARGLEVKELREKLRRLVEEAKRMSSENVKLRKRMSSEQERWRAAERSRAKQDDRRRTEMEHKSDDLHALRYRMQELEARLLSETVRRQGAEEDVRLSQEVGRRSMEELLASRKMTMTTGRGGELAHSDRPHLLGPAPATASTGYAWKPRKIEMVQDVATSAEMKSGARSSQMSDAFGPDERVRHRSQKKDYRHRADYWRLQETATRPGRDGRTPATTTQNDLPPSASVIPTSRRPLPPPPSQLRRPPSLTASSLLASLGGRGGQRSPPPAGAGIASGGAGFTYPGLRPNPQSPVREEDGFLQETRPRPQPRLAPSEDDGGHDADRTYGAGCKAVSTGCGGGGLAKVDSDDQSEESERFGWCPASLDWEGLDNRPSNEDEDFTLKRDEPLQVVSL